MKPERKAKYYSLQFSPIPESTATDSAHQRLVLTTRAS